MKHQNSYKEIIFICQAAKAIQLPPPAFRLLSTVPNNCCKMEDPTLLDQCPNYRDLPTFLQIQILLHGVNSEDKAKLNTLSRECLILGFEEELGKNLCA
jgi:hypothetical protein